MKKFAVLAVCGAAVLLLATPSAHAQRIGGFGGLRVGAIRPISVGGWSSFRLAPRLYHGGWAHGWGHRWYASPGYYPYYSYPADYYEPNVVTSYSAYYTPVADSDPRSVTIRMRVPGSARVWFDGAATSQTGPDRWFESPALTPGREFVYNIRVQWQDNGKAVERSRAVTVHAGDRINLTFEE
jgi:uncharacterized protein (TIGR03000 family)